MSELRMFAKLKKKIETEGGADSPGKPSGRRDSVSSLPGAGSMQHFGPSPPGSVTSEVASIQDVSSAREEMASLLQRKSEQCKKLEGNISDLAALIKDKSRTIEKLETAQRLQEEVTNKKLQEQKEEFEKYRDKLIDGYQGDRIKLDKEKNELLAKLASAEEYRARYFKKEEETDEFEGLKIQELSKVKHLLLNTEEALSLCKSELETMSRQCHAAQAHVERLTDELGPLRQKVTTLESEIVKLREENNERAELVSLLSKDKAAFDKRLDEMNIEMVEKQTCISQLHSQIADLDGEHKTLLRNSDLHRNKTGKLLQEKDDLLDTLQEKIKTLEQRVCDSSLSGDDRQSAFHQEREMLEQRLSETRLQLTEVKSTWSDKITQLEGQISNLNAKIMEDSEEFAANQKMADQMRENFHKQVEDLRAKLEDAEQRALENLELASSKDTHYDKQIEEMEHESRKQQLQAAEVEGQLRVTVASLDVQVKELETAKALSEEEAGLRIAQLEQQVSDLDERRGYLEARVQELEEAVNNLQKVISHKDDTIKALNLQLQDRESTCNDHTNMNLSLQQQVQDLTIEAEEVKKDRDNYKMHLQISEEEKQAILEQNADLHQQVQMLRSSSSDSRLELQRMVELKSQTIESLRKSEAALRQKLDSFEQTIELNEISKAESGLYSDRLDGMSKTISSLQTQLAEKNRMVKKQEQTLKDLRMTLHRELKIQSLPNDEGLDLTANNTSSNSPVMSRKFGSDSRLCPKPQDLQLNQQQRHYQQQISAQPDSLFGNSNVGGLSPQISSSNTTSSASASHPVSASATDTLIAHTAGVKRDLNKDINFLYLKHVILKFMLSRESEAIQLIKAVSMLLNFTHQEQQLIKDTLEWKMSWFGHRPPVGKGQTSKVIPPTL